MSEFPSVIAGSGVLLDRVRHLAGIQVRRQSEMNQVGIRLVRYSLIAAREDCEAAGLGAEALGIIRTVRP